MAIGSVANFMYRKAVKSARDINSGLASLQAAAANDERYGPAQFEAALRDFRGRGPVDGTPGRAVCRNWAAP